MRVSSRVHIAKFDDVDGVVVSSTNSPTVSNDRAAPAHGVHVLSSRDDCLDSIGVVSLEVVIEQYLYGITQRLTSPSISIRVSRLHQMLDIDDGRLVNILPGCERLSLRS